MTRPRKPVNAENPQNLRHQEIVDRFSRATTSANVGMADRWRTLAERYEKALDRFNRDFRNATELSWQGASKDAAVNAVSGYVRSAQPLKEAIDAQAQIISSTSLTLFFTKNAIPAVPEKPKNWDSMSAEAKLKWQLDAERLEQQARTVMAGNYVSNIPQLATTIPDPPVVAGLIGDGAQDSPADSGGAARPPGGPVPASSQNPAGANPGQQAPSGGGPAAASAPQNAANVISGQNDSQNPGTTNPAATQTAALDQRAGTPGFTGGGGVLPPGGTSGGGNDYARQPGSPLVAGVPGVPAPPASGQAPAAAARAVPGSPGMGGMPRGQQQQRDEAQAKRKVDLVSAANGAELIGELPKTAPPVIEVPSKHQRDKHDS